MTCGQHKFLGALTSFYLFSIRCLPLVRSPAFTSELERASWRILQHFAAKRTPWRNLLLPGDFPMCLDAASAQKPQICQCENLEAALLLCLEVSQQVVRSPAFLAALLRRPLTTHEPVLFVCLFLTTLPLFIHHSDVPGVLRVTPRRRLSVENSSHEGCRSLGQPFSPSSRRLSSSRPRGTCMQDAAVRRGRPPPRSGSLGLERSQGGVAEGRACVSAATPLSPQARTSPDRSGARASS